MTPDQKFARWIKYSCIGFVFVFAYFLIADLTMPLTPQALATRVVTKVAPRISGQITAIHVENNQVVHKGDILFEIDPQQYQLAVDQAQLNLERVMQDNDQLDASIIAAKADVDAAKIVLEQREREYRRLNTLLLRNGTSRQLRDDALSAATAAKANLAASRARLKELEVSRGDIDDDKNVNIRVAQNQLAQAELNLSYTKIIADNDGIVTNLQLDTGTYAAAGNPLLALVDNQVDVIADFREKSLRHFGHNSQAMVAFDSKPGQVFTAEVGTIDAGVSSGQFDADGRLATPTTSNRWVRDAQRMRLHLIMHDEELQKLPAGARATVQLLPESPVLNLLAKAQIHFLSTLHYIY
ncbi:MULTISPECIES: HlyD family secretion protein [unclassified Vibrio]|uniref:HlyD family secretion protein n=1 Tax=unclassified Vibrio TaxID=2614977 RepID=UPI0010A691F5|nr:MULTISPECIES: HlyD family secretion protein [unclassified Vibrio]WGY45725.1 HlyD family secretion protein [Vibrio sp. ABG19]